jgi:gamma-glutamylcyclotransferase
VFGKRSIDKSGKATLVSAEGIHTPGVAFEIAEDERRLLNAAEGFKHDKPDDPARYRRDDNFQIQLVASESIVAATTYLANKPEDGLKPYDWYLALLIAGSVEHSLDSNHVKNLKRTESDKTNDTRHKAIGALKSVGYEKYETLLLI